MSVRAVASGQVSNLKLKRLLGKLPSLRNHPQSELLIEIVCGETQISSAGFPYISDRSFRLFIGHIPHLFQEGQAILSWLRLLDGELSAAGIPAQRELESLRRAIKVLRTIVFTAGVTAPPDLWLLRQVLSTHKKIGTVDWLLAGNALEPEEYARDRKLDSRQLEADLHLLYSRGYLKKGDGNYVLPDQPAVVNALKNIPVIKRKYRINLVPRLAEWFNSSGKLSSEEKFLAEWLRFDGDNSPTGSWIANHFQIELGYRLLPLILALRVADITFKLRHDVILKKSIPRWLPGMAAAFEQAGLTETGRVTELGERVFGRGPGPFGIIGAYHSYLNHHEALLKGREVGAWVHRGENVAASQDANRKTFEAGNDRLDAFCRKYHFRYSVFIEHAVGRGEATRQRFERSGEERIRYFGADLEDAAIDQAIEQQKRGLLPQNMQFIRSADIGKPEKVIRFLEHEGLAGQPAVMMVGNGFHEIREQTNEKMIAVFRAYREAGFVLIFTEESALHDEALISTAWNTYHAGFRYVHAISGQGLRPALETSDCADRWSWGRCAREGGYLILDEFSYRSRTIYPHKRPKHKNPSISVTYFCVPESLARELGIKTIKIPTKD